MESFVQILGKYSDRFNQDLERFFPVEEDVSHIAFKAMHYSITNGGQLSFLSNSFNSASDLHLKVKLRPRMTAVA